MNSKITSVLWLHTFLFLHITFLFSKPAKADLKPNEEKKSGDEEILLKNEAIYLYCPHGYGKSKLNNSFLESKLGVTATTRNWKTVSEILKLAEEIG